MSEAVDIGDVVQLDPSSDLGQVWGPQLVVVTEPKAWGFQGYMLHAAERGKFGPAYLRVKSGTFERVGRVVWMVGDAPEEEPASETQT